MGGRYFLHVEMPFLRLPRPLVGTRRNDGREKSKLTQIEDNLIFVNASANKFAYD